MSIKAALRPKDGYIVEDIMQCYESRLETIDFDTAFTIIDEFNRTNMDEFLGPMVRFAKKDTSETEQSLNGNSCRFSPRSDKGFRSDSLSLPSSLIMSTVMSLKSISESMSLVMPHFINSTLYVTVLKNLYNPSDGITQSAVSSAHILLLFRPVHQSSAPQNSSHLI